LLLYLPKKIGSEKENKNETAPAQARNSVKTLGAKCSYNYNKLGSTSRFDQSES